MRRVRMTLLASLIGAALSSTSAHAFMNPYVRIGFAGNQLKMDDANAAIAYDVGQATAAGLPVSAKRVGPGWGPSLSAGFWLAPFIRVGASYSNERSRANHEYRDVGYLYQDNYHFQMEESGIETALRVPALAGFTFGGRVSRSRATANNDFALENIHGNYYENNAWSKTKQTYAVFLGLDQNEENGIAGFVHLGYQWRDMGSLDGNVHVNDNGTLSDLPSTTVPLDYSGWSFRVGVGYDLRW